MAQDLPDDLVIRPSTVADAPGVWRCLDAVARERRYIMMVEAPPLEAVRAFLAGAPEAGVIQLVAETGGGIVGWADVARQPHEGFRHGATLGMGLLAGHRGRGLGAALLAALLDEAGAQGIRRVELEVYASNRAAIALYERFGFEREGRKRAARILDGRTEDVLCMGRVRPAAA